MKIPRIIHQSWKTEDIPEQFSGYRKKLINLHPNWEYRFWTDEDNINFVREHYPRLLDKYVSFPDNIMRVNTMRYMIMDKIGGFYCDLDFEIIKPIDDLISGTELLLAKNRDISFNDNYDSVGDSLFASVAGHRFWSDVINEIASVKDISVNSRKDIIDKIAAGLLTRVYYADPDKYSGILLNRKIFHYPEKKLNILRKFILKGTIYGIHHCAGTWDGKYKERMNNE